MTITVPLGTAQASTGCDSTGPQFDKYVPLMAFQHDNRVVRIMTGKVFEYSYAKIEKGHRTGDKISYDRRERGSSGYRRCGTSFLVPSQSGKQRHRNLNPGGKGFQVRACLDPTGPTGEKCSPWYNGSGL